MQRPRSTDEQPGTKTRDPAEGELVEQYVAAFAEDDIDALVALVCET